MTDKQPAGRPNVDVRRRQIREAASRCARRAGFHGATMADIAKAAGLSVGQIYRCFENKEAIIAAIVDKDVADMRERFAELENSGKPLVEAVVDNAAESIALNYDPERAALRLEVIAEAARNPRVGTILRASDAEERVFKRAFLEGIGPPGRSDRDLEARGEVLSMLFEGMLIRGVNNPGSDQEAIAEVLGPVLRHLLAGALGAPSSIGES